jgi:hypothetical protein
MFGVPSIVPEVGEELLCLPRFHACFPLQASSIVHSAGGVKSMGNPAGCREQGFEPLGRLQLQIIPS